MSRLSPDECGVLTAYSPACRLNWSRTRPAWPDLSGMPQDSFARCGAVMGLAGSTISKVINLTSRLRQAVATYRSLPRRVTCRGDPLWSPEWWRVGGADMT